MTNAGIQEILEIFLIISIDAVRRPSPQVVVGNAHPTKKLDHPTVKSSVFIVAQASCL